MESMKLFGRNNPPLDYNINFYKSKIDSKILVIERINGAWQRCICYINLNNTTRVFLHGSQFNGDDFDLLGFMAEDKLIELVLGRPKILRDFKYKSFKDTSIYTQSLKELFHGYQDKEIDFISNYYSYSSSYVDRCVVLLGDSEVFNKDKHNLAGKYYLCNDSTLFFVESNSIEFLYDGNTYSLVTQLGSTFCPKDSEIIFDSRTVSHLLQQTIL